MMLRNQGNEAVDVPTAASHVGHSADEPTASAFATDRPMAVAARDGQLEVQSHLWSINLIETMSSQ